MASLVACGGSEEQTAAASPSVGTADLDAVEKRWSLLTVDQREEVCSHYDAEAGRDQGLASALSDVGMSEDQAAEMVPSVMDWCT
ncbi:hypothetical protein KME66_20345 [Streptomyces sp. YPW6]|uniref:hypothetical protein n=1 Tax=Streptomyces sp. YPW6 TaxID=2840373 RepID=UPI001C0B8A73|nr:hypothetical protein [Streptomyces sp. YPW6]QWQ43063.1 hypothetical protein KME66_20345 [Streptomyces sp. YPW6]